MEENPLRSTVPAAPRPGVPKDPLYQAPAVAWPSLGLFALALLIWGGALWGAVEGHLHPALAVALQTVAAFMQFTVLHDGVHRSLLRGYPRLNDLVAGIGGSFLGIVGSVTAFRYAHFAHHRYTNETERDPDLWSGTARSPWLLPLHWATADLYYALLILRDRARIPAKDQLAIVGTVALILGGYATACALGYGYEATLYWLLPSRLAILWLACAFNYLPHHPHAVEQSHNPYAATNVRAGGEPLMRWLFLYQNYHLIHHLFPSVPFYRYRRIWRQRETEFVRLGAPVVRWWQLETSSGH